MGFVRATFLLGADHPDEPPSGGGSVRRIGQRRGNEARRKRSLQDDSYRLAVSAPWPAFFAVPAAGFLGINALFACLYLACGDGIAGARPTARS